MFRRNNAAQWAMKVFSLQSVFCAVLLAACGGIELPAQERVERQAFPIVKGTNDSGHPSAAFINYFQGTSTAGYMCTGTLIGTQSVVTAGHCVLEGATYSVQLGNKTYGATRVVRHPSYDTNGQIQVGSTIYQGVIMNDIALITLDQEVTDVTPVRVATQVPTMGTEITIVGFGLTGANQQTSGGVKRVAKSKISQLDQEYFIYGLLGYAEGGNTCFGDSGGPTYIMENGEEKILGVHSMGDMACNEYGYDMMTSFYMSWLVQESGGNVTAKPDDTKGPTVTFQQPQTSTSVAPTLVVKVAATDESGLSAIELFLDGKSQGTQLSSPASFTLSNLTEGAHQLRAEAKDKEGNLGQASLAVTVQDDAQTVSLSPEDPPPGGGSTSPFSEIGNSGQGKSGEILIQGGCSVTSSAASGSLGPSAALLLLLLVWGRFRRQSSR